MGREPEVDDSARLARLLLQHDVEQFLYAEARHADDSDYESWLAMYDEEVSYWVPRGPANYDPTTQVSYINDNRTRLETRVRQLQTGVHWAQSPPSVLSRQVTNVEILEPGSASNNLLAVRSKLFVSEYSAQAGEQTRSWAGRVHHELRRSSDSFRIRSKTVELVGSERSLPTMAFLL